MLRTVTSLIAPEEVPKFSNLGWQMLRFMEALEGVGLAAPQIGVPRSLLVYNVGQPQILINPEITGTHGTQTDIESCLSLPGLRCEIDRAMQIEVKYLDENGAEVKREASGLEARVIQHEIDHLQGKLFIDLSPVVKKQIQVDAQKGRFHEAGRNKVRRVKKDQPDLVEQVVATIKDLS